MSCAGTDTLMDTFVNTHMSTYSMPAAIVSVRAPSYCYNKGYNTSEDILMRVASVEKAVNVGIAMNTPVSTQLNSTIYDIFAAADTPLPTPLDSRMEDITIQHLIDHKSGLDNAHIGGDIAGQAPIEQLMPAVVTTYTLASNPGTTSSYSNLGYCILAYVIELINKNCYKFLAQDLLNSQKVFQGKANFRWPGEIATYTMIPTSATYPVSMITGAGNMVVSSKTLADYALGHYLAGPNAGKVIPAVNDWGSLAIIGSITGTNSYLFQWLNGLDRYSIALSFNSNVTSANQAQAHTDVTNGLISYVNQKFGI